MWFGKQPQALLEHQHQRMSSYSVLPYQKVTLLLYHTILQYLQHPKTLFLLKYYFLIFLYYFFPTVTPFQALAWFDFPGLSNSIFFPLFLIQPLAPVQHTEPHTHTQTHDTPINLSKPITTHTEPHTHTNTNHQQSHTHKHKLSNHQQNHTHTNHQTSWSQQQPSHPPPKPLISKPKPPIRNPRRRFETHRSKPIQKKIIIGATIRATDDQPHRSTHQSIDSPFQTHHQPIPAHQSKPSLSIHNERWERGRV